MVEFEFTCCEVTQIALVDNTGTVEEVEIPCGFCGQTETREVDTVDYN